MTFRLLKLVLEKAEEPEIKLPTSVGSSKKQERSRKTSTSAFLTTPKHLTIWITGNTLSHISLKSFCIPFLDPISPAVPQPLFREAISYFVFTIFLLFFILYYISMYLEATNNLILLLFSHSVVSNSLRLHGLQHAMLPCPSLSPGVCSNSCPLSQWCHPTISSSVIPFSCLQFFPGSGSFLMSQFFVSGGQSIGAPASASILPMNTQNLFPLQWLFDLLAV